MTINNHTSGYDAAIKIARSLEGEKLFAEIARLDADITDEAFVGVEVRFTRDGQVSSLIVELTTRFDNGYPANPVGASFHQLGEMSENDRLAIFYEHIKARIASNREFCIEDGQIDLAA